MASLMNTVQSNLLEVEKDPQPGCHMTSLLWLKIGTEPGLLPKNQMMKRIGL